jgi:hypothetical protein
MKNGLQRWFKKRVGAIGESKKKTQKFKLYEGS